MLYLLALEDGRLVHHLQAEILVVVKMKSINKPPQNQIQVMQTVLFGMGWLGTLCITSMPTQSQTTVCMQRDVVLLLDVVKATFAKIHFTDQHSEYTWSTTYHKLHLAQHQNARLQLATQGQGLLPVHQVLLG